MAAAAERRANGGYIRLAVGANRKTIFVTGRHLTNRKGDLYAGHTARRFHKNVKLLGIQPFFQNFLIAYRGESDFSLTAEFQILQRHALCQQARRRFAVKQKPVDFGGIDAAFDERAGNHMRGGRDVGIPESSGVRADSRIQTAAKIHRKRDSVGGQQGIGDPIHDLSGRRGVRINISGRIGCGRLVVVDHERNVVAEHDARRAELCQRGRVNRDDPFGEKVLRHGGGHRAGLNGGREKAQALGNLVGRRAVGFTAFHLQNHLERKGGTDGVAVRPRVTKDQRFFRLGQHLTKDGEGKLTHDRRHPLPQRCPLPGRLRLTVARPLTHRLRRHR